MVNCAKKSSQRILLYLFCMVLVEIPESAQIVSQEHRHDSSKSVNIIVQEAQKTSEKGSRFAENAH